MTHQEFCKYLGRYNTCLICGESVYIAAVKSHLASHGLTSEEYYDKFVESDNICRCGKKKRFLKMSAGYSISCGNTQCKFDAKSESVTKSISKLSENPEYLDRISKIRSENSSKRWSISKYRKNISDKVRLSWVGSEDRRKSLSDSMIKRWKNNYSSMSNISAANLLAAEVGSMYLYVIVNEVEFKIGVTRNPLIRCSGYDLVYLKFIDCHKAIQIEKLVKDTIPISVVDNSRSGKTEWRPLEYLPDCLDLLP